MENFALIDNNLAAAQLAIGESSNLAQICLTYTYNFEDQKYMDYVTILSVVAQIAIDSAKRRFDIDIVREIARIKADMEVRKHGYPMFWGSIRKDFNQNRINPSLQCPMNYIYSIIVPSYNPPTSTLRMSEFFIQHELQDDRRKCKKVEELIWKYSLDLYNSITDEDDDDTYLLLRSDYNQLIEDIRRIKLSSTYAGLFSWLLNRAFVITGGAKSKEKETQTNIRANKSLLIKTLYDTNPKVFLSCFTSKK